MGEHPKDEDWNDELEFLAWAFYIAFRCECSKCGDELELPSEADLELNEIWDWAKLSAPIAYKHGWTTSDELDPICPKCSKSLT